MTRRADYTSDEWALLMRSVEFVGLAMLAVSKSGPIGKLRELNALAHCLQSRATPRQFKRNALVQALLADVHEQAVKPFAHFSRNEPSDLIETVATARLRTVICCEQVAGLLAAKTPWGEADGLKRWLLWIATRVAKASGDSLLGLGRRVSEEEAAMLNLIAIALHSSSGVPVPTAAELDTMLGLTPFTTGTVSSSSDDREYPRNSGR